VRRAGLVLNRDRVVAALRGKRARGAGASAGYVLTVLAVIVLANFLSTRHHKRFDLTENKAFSLSEQTIKVVESLPREVAVTAFYREAEPARQKLEDLLAEYRYHSPKLTVRYIDPDTHPGETCASDRMADLFASIAPQIAVPVLWFYAENDEFIGPRVQKLWFESFRAAGGRGELVVVPPFPERRGHGVFAARAGVPLWTAAVAGFFKSQELALPF